MPLTDIVRPASSLPAVAWPRLLRNVAVPVLLSALAWLAVLVCTVLDQRSALQTAQSELVDVNDALAEHARFVLQGADQASRSPAWPTTCPPSIGKSR